LLVCLLHPAMTRCLHCGVWNTEEEHHCGNCGQSPSGELPLPRQRRFSRKPQPALADEPAEAAQRLPRQARQPGAPHLPGKVIPIKPPAPAPPPAPAKPREPRPRAATSPRRGAGPRSGVPTAQSALPFPPPPQQRAPAALRGAAVADIGLRCQAALLDGVLFLIGSGVFVATFVLMGNSIALAPKTLPYWGGAFLALLLFYRVYWCALGCDSPGMQFFRLRLVNFDGDEPEPFQRWVRLVTGCLGLAAAGLGLLWALFDADKFTWHDHISKTYPAVEPPPERGRR